MKRRVVQLVKSLGFHGICLIYVYSTIGINSAFLMNEFNSKILVELLKEYIGKNKKSIICQ